jgi:hypothetical protein
MNKVVKILMERDDIDQETAEALVRETRDELLNIENVFEADDIIRDYLELEPDYIFDILDMK